MSGQNPLIIAGPSGSGKTAVAKLLLDLELGLIKTISATTRPPRTAPAEEDGRDYYFLSEKEFSAKYAAGEFVEINFYDGYRYGTLWSEIERIVQCGKRPLLNIDRHGIEAIKKLYPDTEVIWLTVTKAEARRRILLERDWGPDELADRFSIADEEIAWVHANSGMNGLHRISNMGEIEETIKAIREILFI